MWSNLSRLNKILIIATMIMIPIAIVITVLQVQSQQTIKQKAYELNALGLEAFPNTGSYILGESIDVRISLANNSKDISGIDITINYDANVLRFENFNIFNPGFTTIINNTSVPGKIHYAAINSSTVPLDSVAQFEIGTLAFTSISATGDNQVTGLSFSNPIITAANFNDGLPVSQRAGQYTIEISTTPTLQPTSIPTPIISSKCPSGTSLCGDTCYIDPCDNGNPLVCENGIHNCEITSPTEAPPMWSEF